MHVKSTVPGQGAVPGAVIPIQTFAKTRLTHIQKRVLIIYHLVWILRPDQQIRTRRRP